tara:strand:+ start:1131 stop:2117 length:987 start_codon:yes stop_codon:yes gene_type:complete
MLSLNQPSQNTPKLQKLHIWIFHDARPGHLSQLEGLASRLSRHIDCEIDWIDVNQHKLSLKNAFYLPQHFKTKVKPNLVIGAGHSTHLSVLIAGFLFKAFTSIIMKPSLPVSLFDSVICPKHDQLNDSKKVLTTFGPINRIDKSQLDNSDQNITVNLILIGGLSKHYHFDDSHIIEQIKTICTENPNKQWLLSNSPRTPQTMNKLLNKLELPNISIHDYKQDTMSSIQEVLLKTKFTWVTPDSMSMIFEALTAGSQVGLIDCKPKKVTRIVKQVDSLIDQGYVIPFNRRTVTTAQKNDLPWEADRAALWLLHQFQTRHSTNTSHQPRS